MPKKRKSRKIKKNKNNMLIYLILIGFVVLIGFVMNSSSNNAENYSFCKKLKELNKNSDNYTKLNDELKKLCESGRELSKDEQKLGNLSVKFIESLSNFTANWKSNESMAKTYAKETDSSYIGIKGINASSPEIQTQVDSLYKVEIDYLVDETNLQKNDITNLTYSIKQLEEKNVSLTAELNKIKTDEENTKEMVNNLSLLYSQKKNESRSLESNLSFSKIEYEKHKDSFIANLIPFLLIGIAFGGMIGFALSLRWKKERSYWDAYSSSAKVISPLKITALLTGALLAALLLYFFLSGKLEAILAG